MKQYGIRRGVDLGIWFAVFIAVGATTGARAAGTNAAPKDWSFEGQAVGTAIVDTNSVGYFGWEGAPFSSSNNAGEVVAMTPPPPPNGYPLPGEAHDKVMQVLGDVAANFDTNSTYLAGATQITIDSMVQAGRLPYGDGDGPEPPPGIQLAAFFNTNGLLTVRNSIYTNSFGNLTRTWTTIQHTPVDSNDWVRMTITMYYPDKEDLYYNDHYYSVVMNGIQLTSPWAYTNYPVVDPGDLNFPSSGPGTTNHWFLCADSGFGDGVPNNRYFSGLAFSGAGNVDDVVVAAPVNVGVALSPYELWAQQIDDPGLRGPNDDADGDGATNLDEYYSGTDPDLPGSVFKVTLLQRTGTVSRVEWLGTTNSGFTTTYSMYRSTNLLSGPAGWILVGSNIQRSASGTNLWFDDSPPAAKSFYKPTLPTNAP